MARPLDYEPEITKPAVIEKLKELGPYVYDAEIDKQFKKSRKLGPYVTEIFNFDRNLTMGVSSWGSGKLVNVVEEVLKYTPMVHSMKAIGTMICATSKGGVLCPTGFPTKGNSRIISTMDRANIDGTMDQFTKVNRRWAEDTVPEHISEPMVLVLKVPINTLFFIKICSNL